MERKPYFSNLRLYVIGILMVVLLTSCKQYAQLNFSPAAEEIPTPGSIDSAILLSSYYLVCPTIPSTAPLIPPGPYDEDNGDCALRGKSAEIEIWLTELELIAESCHTIRDQNWTATLAVRSTLDARIDELEEVGVVTAEDDDSLSASKSREVCPSYDTHEPPDDVPEDIGSPNNDYTNSLRFIDENVGRYCIMVDELVKPIWQACDEINFYQDCQAPNPEQYHSIIEREMNTAQIKYSITDSLFTNTIQNISNFRTNYIEPTNGCPLDPATDSPSTFTFYMNAFGRFGPSSEYEKVFTFLELQSVEISGRNRDEPRWWLVLIPGSDEHCWVSDSTGSAAGFLEDLKIVAAPPLVIKPVENIYKKPNAKVCSKDLGPSACVAAGGTWVDGGAVGVPYCDC